MTDEFIREAQCRRITGLSRSTRWRLERAGEFPRRHPISPGCVGWLRSEIEAWVTARTSAAAGNYRIIPSMASAAA
jgi:prophage regulatory protein